MIDGIRNSCPGKVTLAGVGHFFRASSLRWERRLMEFVFVTSPGSRLHGILRWFHPVGVGRGRPARSLCVPMWELGHVHFSLLTLCLSIVYSIWPPTGPRSILEVSVSSVHRYGRFSNTLSQPSQVSHPVWRARPRSARRGILSSHALARDIGIGGGHTATMAILLERESREASPSCPRGSGRGHATPIATPRPRPSVL